MCEPDGFESAGLPMELWKVRAFPEKEINGVELERRFLVDGRKGMKARDPGFNRVDKCSETM